MNDPDLAPLAEDVPAPRRSDAAFCRAVADDVKKRRARAWLFGPVFAATAVAGLALVVSAPPSDVERIDAGTIAMMDDEDPLFAIPALDGSTDEELERLERALDRALEERR